MSRAKLVVMSLVVLGGIGAGYGVGSSQVKTDYKVITLESPPQVLTHVETKEVVKPASLPTSCRTLLRYESSNFAQDKIISEQAGKIDQAIQEGVTHLAMNEPTKWVAAEQLIIDAQEKLSTALVTKGNNASIMARLTKECDEDLKKTP